MAVADERSAGEIDRRLGARVRARRLAIDMSQERLAELLGVTFQQVQKYEKGVNRIAASRLLDIADALDQPVSQFFEGLRPGRRGARQADEIEDALAKPGVAELIRLFVSLRSDKVRRQVLELVRTMTED